MRVIVVKQYKQYATGTELDISESLWAENKQYFKPIVTIRANTSNITAAPPARKDEEE
jgi:hypothetical protein